MHFIHVSEPSKCMLLTNGSERARCSLQVCLLQGLLSKEDLHVNMCDALANLPTDLGIEAIETFSRRASSEPVRNKTGFMVRALHLVTMY